MRDDERRMLRIEFQRHRAQLAAIRRRIAQMPLHGRRREFEERADRLAEKIEEWTQFLRRIGVNVFEEEKFPCTLH